VRGGYCSGYHPDFLAIDSDGVHWVIEAKSHRDLESEDVQAKREAGQRWANHVSADEKAPPRGAISLVSEDDVKIAKGDGGHSRVSRVPNVRRHPPTSSLARVFLSRGDAG
jgi:hypothetical protein